MSNEVNERKPVISDYFYVLFKWKKFILFNLLIVTIIAIVISLLIPNQYKSTATIMIPPENQSGLSGLGNLSGLMGSKTSIASLGSKLLGTSGGVSEDVILGIINSRSTLTNLIKKFDLMDYYDIDGNNLDKAIKAFSSDISADANEFGMIEISTFNKNPNISARMSNYIVHYVDSVNIEINMGRAKNYRKFIEKRYLLNVSDLRHAEDSLYKFQKKFGIVAVPEQLEVTVKAAAEVESALFKKEMESYFIKQTYGENSPQYMGAKEELGLLKNKVSELKNSTTLGETSNILFPFKKMPDIAIDYLRVYREVEIQQSILEIVLPMYEQAKVEEQKSIPTIEVIDKAVPAQLKYSPKRSFIVIGIILLFSFFLIPFVYVSEKAVTRNIFDNPLQIKEANFIKRVLAFYKIKF